MSPLQTSKFINYTLAFLWIYQGLVPKLLFINADEINIWQSFGLSYTWAVWAGQFSGIIEIMFGSLFIFLQHKFLHYCSILGLILLLVLVAFLIPDSFIRGFNPVVMNIAMISLSIIYLQHSTSRAI